MKSTTNTQTAGGSSMAYSHVAMHRALTLGQRLGRWITRSAV